MTDIQKETIINNLEKDNDYILSLCDHLLHILRRIIDPDKERYICMSRDDATILGLFIKQYKYLQDIVNSFKSQNTHLFFLLQRIRYEAIIKMLYLIKHPEARREYRIKSYKNRHNVYKEHNDDTMFLVMISKYLEDIQKDGFSIDELNKIRDWKLGSMNFDGMVNEVDYKENYRLAYGLPSDMIHSDWGEIRQLYLNQDEEGTRMFHDLEDKPLHYRALLYELAISCKAATSYMKWIEDLDEIEYSEQIKTRIHEIYEILIVAQKHVFNIYSTSPDTYMTI